MNVDMKKIFDDAVSVSVLELKDTIKKKFIEFFNVRSRLYFFNNHDIQRYKDNPSLARVHGVNLNDPDLGLVNRMVEDTLTDKILNDDMKLYMRQYMDAKFPTFLNEAMDKAMRHKAHAIAFKEVRKVQGPQRAVVILQEVLKFLEQQGQALKSYGSMAGTDFTEIRLPYAITSKLVNSFAIAFPKCVVKVEDNETSLKVFYDEHINTQA